MNLKSLLRNIFLMSRQIKPVAYIYTGFSSKFGIPRQSGLVPAAGKIVFEKEYRSPDAVRGLEDYSHLWLIWDFSEAHTEEFSPTVRPPRLGGNKRMGVFATRSPFRPNSLGLSLVGIEKIDLDCPDAPVIYVRGADILNGTPVYDIKPYLPFADSVPDAKAGFAGEVAEEKLETEIRCDVSRVPEEKLAEILRLLGQDPRPHYQNDPERVYSFEYDGFHVEFRVEEKKAVLVAVSVF